VNDAARRPRPTAKRAAPRTTATVKKVALEPSPAHVEFDRVDGTAMFETLGKVRALPAGEASRAIEFASGARSKPKAGFAEPGPDESQPRNAAPGRSVAKSAPALPDSGSAARAQGYSKAELFAVAEIGRSYLESGGYGLACVIFEGLEAIDPDEHYFVMALGLTKDRLGEKAEAMRCFRRARQIDPSDARAELNLAELMVEDGKKQDGLRLVRSALQKANARCEQALADKAAALLTLIGGSR
jgi:tetratricopeptide (TPR) repeat protein